MTRRYGLSKIVQEYEKTTKSNQSVAYCTIHSDNTKVKAMLTGVITTGIGPDIHLPYPIEMLPSGSFYEEGVRIKPVVQWTIERMVLAGVQRVIVTVTHESQQSIMDYLGDGSQFLTQIMYARPQKRDIPGIIDSLHDFVAEDTLVVIEPHVIHKPPSCIQQALGHKEAMKLNALTAKVSDDKCIYVLDGRVVKSIRESVMQGNCPVDLGNCFAMARERGIKVGEARINKGSAISPINPIWIQQN